MKGLKLDPGCRHACVTWLNLLRLKSKPPTSARIAPSIGIGGEEGGFDLGQLDDPPVVLVVGLDANDRAAPQALVWRRLVFDHAGRELEALAADGDDLAAAAVGADFLAVGLEHDRRMQVLGILEIKQQLIECLVLLGLDPARST
jgi:hypothetical protein